MSKNNSTPIFRKNLACRDQYLYPQGIFAINRILDEIQDELNGKPSMSKDSMVIVPVVFNKKSRTFHMACVLGIGWGPRREDPKEGRKERDFRIQKNKELLKRAIDYLSEFPKPEPKYNKAFEAICKNLRDGTAYIEAAKKLRNYGELIAEITRGNDKNTILAKQQELMRALHLFYYGFKSHRDLYLAGILNRGLAKYSLKSEVAYFDAMGVPEEKGTFFSRFYKGRFYDRLDKPLEKEDTYDQFKVDYENSGRCQSVTNKPGEAKHGSKLFKELADLFYLSEVTDADNKRFKKEDNGNWFSEGHILLLPIKDVWLGGDAFGGLWGCLIFTFKDEGTKEAFIKGTLRQFLPRCEAIADELFKAGLVAISGEEIKPPYDLVEHFVKTIVHIQDWERISVYRKKDGKKPIYCYKRMLDKKDDVDDLSSDYQWKRCEGKNCIAHDQLQGDNDRILSWHTRDLNIWQKELLPEITSSEIEAFQDITLKFEYPDTVHIPKPSQDGDKVKELFEDAIIHRQIEVLRALIPKIRARRSALRNASVSIMGRNMSHNIGSHVLARYAASGKVDPIEVKQFVRYLQERMDFIADRSTTDVFYSLPTRFHGDAMMGLIGDQKNKSQQEILLKYISGLDDVDVSIHPAKEQGEDFTYDSPGGRLGMHALYVILENIARNTAKHGLGSWKKQKIDLKMTQCTDGENKKLVLKFCLTALRRDALKLCFNCSEPKSLSVLSFTAKINTKPMDGNGLLKVLKDKEWEPNRESLKQIVNASNSGEVTIEILGDGDFPSYEDGAFTLTVAYDVSLNIRVSENGKWKGAFFEVLVWDNCKNCRSNDGKWIPDEINKILKTSIIEDSGEIKPDDWGIREMFLAAAYLRFLPLDELESRTAWPRKDEAPPILEAVAIDDEGNAQTSKKNNGPKLNLGYRFYLKKRQLLIEILEKSEKETWAQENIPMGINVNTYEDTYISGNENPIKTMLEGKEILTHSYGIFQKTAYEKLDDQGKLKLPLMWFDEGDGYLGEKPDKAEKIETRLAEAWWLKHLCERIGDNGDYLLCQTGRFSSEKNEQALKFVEIEEITRSLESALHSGSSNPYLVYDDHNQMVITEKNENKKFLKDLAFYEPYESKNPQSMLIRERDKEKGALYRVMFKTAALTRIVILDERIQAVLSKNLKGDLKFERLFPLMGIFVPSKTYVDLDAVEHQRTEFFSWLKCLKKEAKCRTNGKAYDFIVIHQGIIDKLRRVCGEFDAEFQEEANMLDCKDRIVVCSGRGDPRGSLPTYARFVPVSGIQEWIIHNPSKFHLVNLLCHAKRPG